MLIEATIANRARLQHICQQAYTEVFADHWTGDGLAMYLEQEFGTPRLTADLANDEIYYYFIQYEGKDAGFVKINFASVLTLTEQPNCELEKIYILPKYSGQGLGQSAMQQIIEDARQRGKKILFLCVIDTNTPALFFYQKLGFQHHSKARLEVPLFKEELRGMYRLALEL